MLLGLFPDRGMRRKYTILSTYGNINIISGNAREAVKEYCRKKMCQEYFVNVVRVELTGEEVDKELWSSNKPIRPEPPKHQPAYSQQALIYQIFGHDSRNGDK